jgi:hypothetical protein
VAGRIGSNENSSDLIGNPTRGHPACSIVPQRTTLPRVTYMYISCTFAFAHSLSDAAVMFYVLYIIMLTELPPLVGEVSANFLRVEGVAWSAQRIPTAVNLDFLDQGPLLFHSSSSSVFLTWLSVPRSRPTTSQKFWYCPESNPRPLDL